MKAKLKKPLLLIVVLIAAIFMSMTGADLIQRAGGKIEITTGTIEVKDVGEVYYKLYTPENATATAKAPGVLLLHGYQNDHETCAAYCIELARRGAVVLAIDEFGHGATKIGMKERGYTDHKVTVNFGEEDGLVSIGGAVRYRIMMNFSNLTFFNDKYSKGSDGSSVKDSSMGGVAAYLYLADMENVDCTRMAISGHSMGTWASWTVAALTTGATNSAGKDCTPKATVLQCGELFRGSVYDTSKYQFNNVLLLQAKYDEFSYFRDYKNTVTEDLMKSELRTEFLGVSASEASFNKTFGNFERGSARRVELLMTNHRLTTHHKGGLAVALEWFDNAIHLPTQLDYNNQTCMWKERLVLIAMLCAIFLILPLLELILAIPFFKNLAQPLPPKDGIGGIKKKKLWIRGAIITVLIAGLSYPFMTQLGHGLLPLPEGVFRMTVGNGFVSWYGLLILVMIFTTLLARGKAKKQGGALSMYSIGLGSEATPERVSWALLGKGALAAAMMCFAMYILVFICEKLFALDFRFIWPFFKSFNLDRAGQFGVYILIFSLFYILNNSKIFAGMRTEGTYEPGFKGFISCWWKYALVMVGGVLLVTLIEYIPFFAGIGPGADVLFGSTFGGPFMSLLILFVPQVLVYSILCTYIYRRTGSVYTGAFVVAILSCWIVTGGSAIL